MAGVSDRAFRQTCVDCGAEYTVTEMVSAKALCYRDAGSERLAALSEGELPCAVQIFGHEPEIMAEAVQRICREIDPGASMPTAIDLNMGCPVRKIVSNGEGSALMKNPALAGEIIRAVCAVSPIPVTVKIRTGWNDSSRNAVALAGIAEENGAAMICVHGRTREEMYAPPVDPETIAAVKRAVSIPVVANGGIFSADDALRMLEQTNCDGLMIARGAMGNPWLFGQIRAALDGRSFELPPLEKRLETAMRQVERMILDKGERVALPEARRQLSYYIKGERGSAETRDRLNRSLTMEEFRSIVADFLRRGE